MDARELALWEAEYAIEPWGDWRVDLGSARLACLIANALRGQGRPAAKVSDFMPAFDKPRQTPEEQMWALRAWVAAAGGKVVDGKHNCESGGRPYH